MLECLPSHVDFVNAVLFLLVFVRKLPLAAPLLLKLLLKFLFIFLEGLWHGLNDHLRNVVAEGAMAVRDDNEPLIFHLVLLYRVHVEVCASDQSADLVHAEGVLVCLGLAGSAHVAWLCEKASLADRKVASCSDHQLLQ